MEIAYKTVVLRRVELHRSLVVFLLSNCDIAVYNLFLELSPCHDHIYATDCYRWLDVHGTHRIRRCERVTQLGSRAFLRYVYTWIFGQKFKENPKPSALVGRVDIEARRTLVNST